jgi:hypothetical protein
VKMAPFFGFRPAPSREGWRPTRTTHKKNEASANGWKTGKERPYVDNNANKRRKNKEQHI